MASEKLLETIILAAPQMLSDEWMLIGQQHDTGFSGRIDLLGIDPDGSIILIELKRNRTSREVVARRWITQAGLKDSLQKTSTPSTSGSGQAAAWPRITKLEEGFQRLLEIHTELLAGDLIDSEEPRPMGTRNARDRIPSEADGVGWWSADHLFLDQDGVPTIVEAKRQTDTRLRCEVVGQMLDYAANAVAYLPVAEIRSRFERTC